MGGALNQKEKYLTYFIQGSSTHVLFTYIQMSYSLHFYIHLAHTSE